jgi:hypothetical protein
MSIWGWLYIIIICVTIVLLSIYKLDYTPNLIEAVILVAVVTNRWELYKLRTTKQLKEKR